MRSTMVVDWTQALKNPVLWRNSWRHKLQFPFAESYLLTRNRYWNLGYFVQEPANGIKILASMLCAQRTFYLTRDANMVIFPFLHYWAELSQFHGVLIGTFYWFFPQRFSLRHFLCDNKSRWIRFLGRGWIPTHLKFQSTALTITFRDDHRLVHRIVDMLQGLSIITWIK